ncbi:tryptophan 2,3-dioxygenase family protein [Penaeicola halotolerans]|uniref:tryptophan 2,3-dioxygenase family protein n=1 Tax=Penaeicola halotolerans TaxID=2793196 RepID=UPI001CF86EDD|nr:tryptophan 2,3-dioxygenase family protein [Penaeicola halotolerans]
MTPDNINPNILEKILKLEEKYQAMGQDLSSYLEGLLYADYLKYWDYTHLDNLLSLQHPKTEFKDEMIFIIYHQITELYFKLILWEMDQIAEKGKSDVEFLKARMQRVINYFENLVHSFDVMVDGMEKEQFLKFRMSLLPSSGFQSGQYRMIEVCSTDLLHLVAHDKRADFDSESSAEELYEAIYWKYGATELATGKKTLTLKHFEEKYSEELLRRAKRFKDTNLNQLLKAHPQDEGLKELFKKYDATANLYWPLSHYKSAVRYLQRSPEDIAATGGTNWQKFLPPRFQKIIYFPDLWTAQEKEEWGKGWVLKQLGLES